MKKKKSKKDRDYVNSREIENKWRHGGLILEYINEYLGTQFFYYSGQENIFLERYLCLLCVFFFLKLVGAFDVLNMFF